MKRIAVYGGSFNPPHVAHAMVASWLRWTDQADEVWLVPVFQHAFGKEMMAFERRVVLCRALASELGPWVQVVDIESTLPQPSYTIDTLRAIQKAHPGNALRWVAGSDILQEVHRWKSWNEIERDFAPIIVGRAGYPIPAESVVFPEVSSSEIRRLREQGKRVSHWVPAAVLALLDVDED